MKYILGRIKYGFLAASSPLIFIGFMFVTQAGKVGSSGTVQNDGYAVTGGLMILVGGIMVGISIVLINKDKL